MDDLIKFWEINDKISKVKETQIETYIKIHKIRR